MSTKKTCLSPFALLAFLSACFLVPVFAVQVKAQDNSDQTSPPKRGYQPGSSYALGDIESVNTTNGNVLLHIPLAGLPAGRGGLKASLSLFYNSKLYDEIPRYYYCDSEAPGADTPGNPGVDPPSSPFPECTGDPEGRLRFRVAGRSTQGGWRYGYRFTLFDDENAYYLTRYDSHYNACSDMQAMFHYRMKVVFPDGSEHILTLQGNNSDDNGYARYDFNGHQNPMCTSATNWSGSTMSYYTSDGSYARLEVTLASGDWTLYLSDGSRVTGTGFGITGAERIYDRNDNYVEVTELSNYNSTGHPATVLADQLGRQIVIEKNATANEDYVRVKGVAGADLTTTVKWKSITPRKTYWVHSGATAGLFGGVRVVDQIILPELPAQTSALSYTFGYNAESGNPTNGWGEVSSILLPTGAKVQYNYALDGITGSSIGARDVVNNSPTSKVLTYHAVYDGSSTTVTETTTYDIDQVGGESTITGPDGGVTHQYFTPTMDQPASVAGEVHKTVSPDGTITEQLWGYAAPLGLDGGLWSEANRYLKAEITTVVDRSGTPAKIACKKFTHDMNGNVVSTAEYDFVSPGSVTIPRDGDGFVTAFPSGLTAARLNVTAFANAGSDADATTAGSNDYYVPGAPNLLSAPAWTEVQSGSGTPASRAEFYYDGATGLTTAPTHGNPTKQTVWDSFKGGTSRTYSNPLTATNSNSTSVAYNSYGMPTSTTDANGTVSQITYGNVTGPSGYVTDLYPTQTVTAYGTSVAQTATAIYDYYTGVVTTATDADNSVSTVTTYDDLGRPTLVEAAYGTPVETHSATTYDDNNLMTIVRSDLNVAGDGKIVKIEHYDELGRVRLARVLEDPVTQSATNEQDGIKAQTRYGFVNSGSDHYGYQLTSNPYRATTSSGASGDDMGWTRSLALADGSRSETETFSGSGLPSPAGSNSSSTGKVTTLRDTNKTYVRDQAGKWRMSESNGLGQLVKVTEDPTSSISGYTHIGTDLLTEYTYNTLSNLTGVSMGYTVGSSSYTQTRSFSYSSLSRLISAANPENGTIGYQYDPGGNLTQKTNARSVVTAYTYDSLNRPTARSYSGEPSGHETPNVSYSYDSGSVPYGKGRLASVSNSLGSNAVSTTGYTAYDPLGKVLGSTQTTDGLTQCTGSSAICTIGYKYNLGGALTDETYPSGRIVHHNYAGDGKEEAVSSRAAVNRPFKSYAQNLSYNAAGAVTDMQLGNMRWESTAFNSRLQPTTIALGTTKAATDMLHLDYTYNPTGSADQNNGNVISQTISVPDVGTNHGFVAVQSYTYDELNRLKSATENSTPNGGGSTSQSWKQTYLFDRFGNRTFDTSSGATTTLPSGFNAHIYNPTINPANNQFPTDQDYIYDSAGNVTQDASGKKFAYDGENKQTSFGTGGSSTNGGTYVYDGDGKRIKKIVGTEVTVFVYDAAGQMVAEYATTAPSSPQVNYLTADTLSSPRINTDVGGSVIARHDYLPFGEETSFTGSRVATIGYSADGLKNKFTSKERDSETELDWFETRYFASTQGRFWSADPLLASGRVLSPQSWNRYSYVLNNPLRLIDPTGLIDDDPQKNNDPQPPPVKVSVEVPESQVFTNEKLPNGKYFSGVGSKVTVTLTNGNGKPLSGAIVSESNKEVPGKSGATTGEGPREIIQNKSTVTTSPEGTLKDYVAVGKSTDSADFGKNGETVDGFKEFINDTEEIDQTTEQTLTVKAGDGNTYQITYQRTVTNIGPDGKLNKKVNANGVNVVVRTTTPVITRLP